MSRRQLVTAGGAEFFVEVADTGPAPVSAADALSFDGMREGLEGVADEIAKVWEKVKPTEATVELGLTATVKSGKLTAIIVEGGGEASLKVTLTWKQPAPVAKD